MRFLITGGAGFIGSHIVDELLSLGENVVVIDNFNPYYDPKIKWKNISNAQENPNFKLLEGDILDKDLLNEIFSSFDIDILVHMAAQAGVRGSIKNPELYTKVNVLGTLNLLEMCKKYKIKKMIFGSSSSIYGNGEVPFSENNKVDEPISPYAATKKGAELLCYNYYHLYEIPITCLRFFTVYGPRQRPGMAIHKFTRLMNDNELIPIYGDGSSSRDYTYITDILDGIKSAIKKDLGFETINLGSSDPIKLLDLVNLIQEKMGKEAKLSFLPPQSGDVERTYADVSKAEKLLGYSPKVSIEEGIEKFVKWYLNQKE
ncbi:MAG: GDP-mannose 4,6-dehydratase [Candidatus Humimicrobiia bacterium]